MRLSISSGSIRVGGVELHETFQVTELDAGHLVGMEEMRADSNGYTDSHPDRKSVVFSPKSLHRIERQLAIIIPCMNEEAHLLESVLRGVSNSCLIIIVSNSRNSDCENSNFHIERKLLAKVCSENRRSGIIVHQQDEGVAEAFAAAGMQALTEETIQLQSGKKRELRIRKGKGEAMLVGLTLAKLAGKKFVGFIDADNWVSGAVQEYCKVYAAGLHYALHGAGPDQIASPMSTRRPVIAPHAMVRVKWGSKPKIDGTYLIRKDAGRCSRIVNEWMNHFLSAIVVGDDHNQIIQTANAGEHAMSIELAMGLTFATGYAVEPYQLVDIIERFGCRNSVAEESFNAECSERFHCSTPRPRSSCTVACTNGFTSPKPSFTPSAPKVRIIQIKTLNPHIHDFSKGDEHIEDMQFQGLSTIYHSRLTSQKLKKELCSYMRDNFSSNLDFKREPERTRVYPSLSIMDMCRLRSELKAKARTLEVLGPSGLSLL